MAISVTLTSKAWAALSQKDTEAVLAYTNKCLELYAEQAIKMQSELTEYPQGKQDEIFAYWALNDVATSLFIQGEAYRRADMKEEAKAVYKKLMKEYTFGQAWDTNGWFWKPSEAAKEKLAMIDSGSVIDFGDYSSAFITGQAWRALPEGDVEIVILYTDKVLDFEKAETITSLNNIIKAYLTKHSIISNWLMVSKQIGMKVQ